MFVKTCEISWAINKTHNSDRISGAAAIAATIVAQLTHTDTHSRTANTHKIEDHEATQHINLKLRTRKRLKYGIIANYS